MGAYIAMIDGIQTDEMSYEELKFLVLSKNLPGNTRVRVAGDPAWLTWAEIPALQLMEGRMRAHLSRPFRDVSAATKRDDLRALTAYPFIRGFGNFLIGLSVVVTVIGWLQALSTSQNVGGAIFGAVILTLGVPITIFCNGVAQAIVDIADLAYIKKEK